MMHRLTAGIAIVLVCSSLATHAQEPETLAPELEDGKRVYDRWCAPCHGPGIGLPGFGALPGTQQLSIKYRNTDIPAVLDRRTDLVPAFIETIVRQGVSFMPQFRKTEISDEDLAAMTAYLARNDPGSR
jgi:mono/diheme cytochrome c family protein